MVKLTKIYTRGGDSGETSLGGGARVLLPAQHVEIGPSEALGKVLYRILTPRKRSTREPLSDINRDRLLKFVWTMD